MSRQRMARESTIGNDPLATLIPDLAEGNNHPDHHDHHDERHQYATTESPIRRQKLTIHLEEDLANRIKNAAYWNPRLTIAKIAELGMKYAIEVVERENGGCYQQRESELTGGRPLK